MDQDKLEDLLALNPIEDLKRLALERVASATDRYFCRKVSGVGSVS